MEPSTLGCITFSFKFVSTTNDLGVKKPVGDVTQIEEWVFVCVLRYMRFEVASAFSVIAPKCWLLITVEREISDIDRFASAYAEASRIRFPILEKIILACNKVTYIGSRLCHFDLEMAQRIFTWWNLVGIAFKSLLGRQTPRCCDDKFSRFGVAPL